MSLQSRRLQTKLMLSITAIVVCVTTVLGLLIYNESTGIMEETYRSICDTSIQSYSDMVDLKLSHLTDNIRYRILTDSFIQPFLSANPLNGKRLTNNNSAVIISGIFSQLFTQNNHLVNAAFFDLTGRVFLWSNDGRTSGAFYQKYYQSDLDKTDEWYRATMDALGKEVFWGYNVLWDEGANETSTFSMTKLVRTMDTFANVGVLVINIDRELLSEILPKGDDFPIMIVDENKHNRIVYSNQSEALSQAVLDEYLRYGIEASAGSYYTLRHISAFPGWSFLGFIHKAHTSSSSQYIRTYIILALACILCLIPFISAAMTHFLYKPLRHLYRVITDFGRNHKPIVADFDRSEVGEIGELLKTTVNRNIQLASNLADSQLREKEVEMRMLQSQINPHFLYNTLDTLYMMALVENMDKIAEMTAALSDIFKVALNKGRPYLRLSEELDFIRQYMLIQSIRTDERIQLIIETDPEVEQVYLLKLLIQPFVENSVRHGLEPLIGAGRIEIRAHAEAGFLCVSIIDNGVGVEDLSALDRGFGIRNVRERIKLFYKGMATLNIQSSPQTGTRVEMRLPILRKEEFAVLISKD